MSEIRLAIRSQWLLLAAKIGILFAPIVFKMLLFMINLSHVMRKPVYAISEQQRHRSDSASPQSDHRLCCLLLDSIIPLVSISKILSLYLVSVACGQFVSYLVTNPEDRFSCDEAHLIQGYARCLRHDCRK